MTTSPTFIVKPQGSMIHDVIVHQQLSYIYNLISILSK